LKVLKRIGIRHTTFGPLVDIHEGWIRGYPRTPLLDEPLEVEPLLGCGELPRTVMDGIEGDSIGFGSTRHSKLKGGVMIGWERGTVIGEGLTAGSSPPYQSPPA
jgi:hypothetical protein